MLVASGSAWLATSGFAPALRPLVGGAVRPLPLTAVRLTGGPLKQAQDLDAAYLLSLEPDRMLAFYRVARRARAEGARLHRLGRRRPAAHRAHRRPPPVGGQPDVGGDRRRRFKQRADYIVAELKIVQDANGDGFAGALPGVREAFADVSKGNIQIGQLRSERPVVALVHAAQDVRRPARCLSPHRQRTALDIEVKFAEWAATLSRADGRRPDPADARHRVRRHERGDGRSLRRHRRRALARSVVPLRAQGGARSAEARRGSAERPARQHAGAQADRIGGALRVRRRTGRLRRGDGRSGTRVVNHHTFATGGHGKDEYFREPDQPGQHRRRPHRRDLQRLQHAEADAAAVRAASPTSATPSSTSARCSTTSSGRWIPTTARPATWCRSAAACAASTPTCTAASRAASARAWRATRSTASGSTTKSGDRLWVNLYAPSDRAVGERRRRLDDGDVVSRGRGRDADDRRCRRRSVLTLALRRPSWAGDGFAVRVNGQPVNVASGPGSYVEIAREWQTGRHARDRAAEGPAPRAAARRHAGAPRSCGGRSCSPAISGPQPQPIRGRRR